MRAWDYLGKLREKEGRKILLDELLERVNETGKKHWPNFSIKKETLKRVIVNPYAKNQYTNLGKEYRIAIAETLGTTEDKIVWPKKKLIRNRLVKPKFMKTIDLV